MASCLALAVLGTAAPAVAAGAQPSQATPAQREQAQAHFLKAKAKYGKNQFAEALTEFSASLDVVASPNTRLYVARCQRELGHLPAAYAEFRRTEAEAKELSREDPRYEKAGESAVEERTKLEAQLGFIGLELTHADPTTTVKVAGEEVHPASSSEPIAVMPGTTEVVVETPGRPPIHKSVEVAVSEHKALSIDAAEGAPVASPPPPPPVVVSTSKPGTLRKVAYVTGGVAIVGLGVFAFFGLKANGTYSDLQNACNKGPCPPGHEDQISSGRSQQTVANIGLAVFAVGAIATGTLWVLSTPKKPSAATARIDLGPSYVGVSGGF
jgi:hypothetical protein